MPEILKATSVAIDEAIRGDERARAFADRLKAIMAQLGEADGERLVVEMQNHLIRMNRGRTLDRYAGVALMLLVAQNSIADWIVGDEQGPLQVDASDPRVVAVEAVARALLHKALGERSVERFARGIKKPNGAGA